MNIIKNIYRRIYFKIKKSERRCKYFTIFPPDFYPGNTIPFFNYFDKMTIEPLLVRIPFSYSGFPIPLYNYPSVISFPIGYVKAIKPYEYIKPTKFEKVKNEIKIFYHYNIRSHFFWL